MKIIGHIVTKLFTTETLSLQITVSHNNEGSLENMDKLLTNNP